MNRGINQKQAMILVTLMVLLLGVGVLAHNVNSRYQGEEGNLAKAMKEVDKKGDDSAVKKESSGSSDYFYETRSVREQEDDKSIQTLKAIIADENTSKEQKEIATDKLSTKTTSRELESRVEVGIKSKGYKDAICFLDNDKARVIVQADKITEEKSIEIQDIVKNIANVYDIQIEAK